MRLNRRRRLSATPPRRFAGRLSIQAQPKTQQKLTDRVISILNLLAQLATLGALIVAIITAGDTKKSVKLSERALEKSDSSGIELNKANQVTQKLLDSSAHSLGRINEDIAAQSIIQQKNLKLQEQNLVTMGKVAALNQRSVAALEKQVALTERQPNLMLAVGPDIPSAVRRNPYPPKDLRRYVELKDSDMKLNMYRVTTPLTEEGSSPVRYFNFAVRIRNDGSAIAVRPRLSAIVVDDQNEGIRFSGYKFKNQCLEAGVRIKHTETAMPLEDILPYSQVKSDRLYQFKVTVTRADLFIMDISIWADNCSIKSRRITVLGTDRLYEPTTTQEP